MTKTELETILENDLIRIIETDDLFIDIRFCSDDLRFCWDAVCLNHLMGLQATHHLATIYFDEVDIKKNQLLLIHEDEVIAGKLLQHITNRQRVCYFGPPPHCSAIARAIPGKVRDLIRLRSGLFGVNSPYHFAIRLPPFVIMTSPFSSSVNSESCLSSLRIGRPLIHKQVFFRYGSPKLNGLII